MVRTVFVVTDRLLAACAAATAHRGVAEEVEQAREALAELARHPANRRGWAVTASAAAVRAARASAVLDGCQDPDCAQPPPILAGALRAHALVARCAAIWRTAPAQALAKLHVAAASELADPANLGFPARPAATLPALLALAGRQPGPVAVALVHGYLQAFEVFQPACGVTARVAARVMMITSGLDPKALSAPEVGALRDAEYQSAVLELKVAMTAGQVAGIADWVGRICRHLVRGAAEGRGIAEAAPEHA